MKGQNNAPDPSNFRTIHVTVIGTSPLSLRDMKLLATEQPYTHCRKISPLAIKRAVVEVAKDVVDEPSLKNDVRRNLHVSGRAPLLKVVGVPQKYETRTLLRIIDGPTCRVVSRSETLYENWSLSFYVTYNLDAFTRGDIRWLLERVGTQCGLGTFRPERGGNRGTFRVFRVTSIDTVKRAVA